MFKFRYVVLNYVIVCLQHPIIEDTYPNPTISILGNQNWQGKENWHGKQNWHTKDVLKFYGQSFHQQHHLAMHAKQ